MGYSQNVCNEVFPFKLDFPILWLVAEHNSDKPLCVAHILRVWNHGRQNPTVSHPERGKFESWARSPSPLLTIAGQDVRFKPCRRLWAELFVEIGILWFTCSFDEQHRRVAALSSVMHVEFRNDLSLRSESFSGLVRLAGEVAHLDIILQGEQTIGIESRSNRPKSTQKHHRTQRNSRWSRVGHCLLENRTYFWVTLMSIYCRNITYGSHVELGLTFDPIGNGSMTIGPFIRGKISRGLHNPRLM